MAVEATISRRFASAAAAERRRLVKRKQKHEAALDELVGRIAELDQLGPGPEPADTDPNLLRGAAIRHTAVRILRESCGTGAIHYRDWLRLVESKGYRVAGVRPDAVFLNQVTRHPDVKSSTAAGIYSLLPETREDRN